MEEDEHEGPDLRKGFIEFAMLRSDEEVDFTTLVKAHNSVQRFAEGIKLEGSQQTPRWDYPQPLMIFDHHGSQLDGVADDDGEPVGLMPVESSMLIPVHLAVLNHAKVNTGFYAIVTDVYIESASRHAFEEELTSMMAGFATEAREIEVGKNLEDRYNEGDPDVKMAVASLVVMKDGTAALGHRLYDWDPNGMAVFHDEMAVLEYYAADEDLRSRSDIFSSETVDQLRRALNGKLGGGGIVVLSINGQDLIDLFGDSADEQPEQKENDE